MRWADCSMSTDFFTSAIWCGRGVWRRRECKRPAVTIIDSPQLYADMSIAQNKKAFHDYFIEQKFEAGIMLHGWEVKAIRAGRVQLKEAYVIAHNGEIFLFGAHISELLSASSHVHPEALRTRKLLLHAAEISKLIGKVEQSGFTMVP